MILKCLNCGSTKLRREGQRFVCEVCGESYLEEELREAQVESKKFVEAADQRLCKLLGPVPDDQIDQRLYEIEEAFASFKKEQQEELEQFRQSLLDRFDEIDKKLYDALNEKATPIQSEIASGKITLQEVFDRAYSLEDLGIAAFLIRNNVEKQLKTTFKVPMHDIDFALPKAEFQKRIVDYSYLNPTTNRISTPFKDAFKHRRVIKDGYVVLKPDERFFLAGLTPNASRKAKVIWGTTNQYIHSNEDFFDKESQKPFRDSKEVLINGYNYFLGKGLVDLSKEPIVNRP